MAVLLLIAGPLRNVGSYTVAGALHRRYPDNKVKLSIMVCTVVISTFYLVPQMLGEMLGVILGVVLTAILIDGDILGVTLTDGVSLGVALIDGVSLGVIDGVTLGDVLTVILGVIVGEILIDGVTDGVEHGPDGQVKLTFHIDPIGTEDITSTVT